MKHSTGRAMGAVRGWWSRREGAAGLVLVIAAWVGCGWASAQEPTAPPAERYAYWVLEADDLAADLDGDRPARAQEMTKRLNAIGAQGWLLVGPALVSRGDGQVVYVFQRKLAAGETSAPAPKTPWVATGPRSDERMAISCLRTLVTVQSLFRDADKDGDGNANFAATLEALKRHGDLIDDDLAKGRKGGYRFALEVTQSGWEWSATATPEHPGARSFFADETGVIRFERGKPATAESPPIGR